MRLSAATRTAIVVFSLLPLFRLTHQSLWYDELFTLFVARHTVARVLDQAAWDGFTPPLYYLLIALAQRAGLAAESLRVVSVGFGALALWGLGRLATRLSGARAGFAAVLLAGISPFLVSMSQELRPYTAFLACAACAADAFLEWRRAPSLRRGLAWAAWLLGATAFSYLGLALVPLALVGALVTPAGRRPAAALALVAFAAAALISLPGLRKARGLYQNRSERGRVRWETRPILPFARIVLGGGLRPEPIGDERDRRLAAIAEWTVRAALGLALIAAVLRRDRTLLTCAATLVTALAGVWTADAMLGIGVTTRYLSLALLPFLLLVVRMASAVPWVGAPAAILLAVLQLLALQRYLLEPAYARDDWRALSARLLRLHQPGDLILGFPGHHAAVAFSAYAPELPLIGGFTGRRGEQVYLFREGEHFRGYDFGDQLEEVGADLGAALRRRGEGRRVRIVSYADEDWHGNVGQVVEALGARVARSERFPARETLLIRELAPW